MKIGVLALQGAFAEHTRMLQRMGVSAVEVRLPPELTSLDGLIIPGGESTTIGKLATMDRLLEPLKRFAQTKPIWGTCAGMILMAKWIGLYQPDMDQSSGQPLLELVDITVERNAFGRQKESFQEDLTVEALAHGMTRPFRGVFIRSPRIVEIKGPAKEIACLTDGTPVAARQNNLLVTAFHPELTADSRFHEFFLSFIK